MMRNSGKFNNIPKHLLYTPCGEELSECLKSEFQKFLQAGHSLYTSFDVNKRPYLK